MNKELLKEKFNYLENKYKGMLNISIEFFDGIINQCTVPMIDSKGNFFLDTIFDGIKYIGRDSKNPSLKEYMSELNCEGHAKEYLTLTKRGIL